MKTMTPRAAFRHLHPRKKLVPKKSPKAHFYLEVADGRRFCNHACPEVILPLQGTSHLGACFHPRFLGFCWQMKQCIGTFLVSGIGLSRLINSEEGPGY